MGARSGVWFSFRFLGYTGHQATAVDVHFPSSGGISNFPAVKKDARILPSNQNETLVKRPNTSDCSHGRLLVALLVNGVDGRHTQYGRRRRQEKGADSEPSEFVLSPGFVARLNHPLADGNGHVRSREMAKIVPFSPLFSLSRKKVQELEAGRGRVGARAVPEIWVRQIELTAPTSLVRSDLSHASVTENSLESSWKVSTKKRVKKTPVLIGISKLREPELKLTSEIGSPQSNKPPALITRHEPWTVKGSGRREVEVGASLGIAVRDVAPKTPSGTAPAGGVGRDVSRRITMIRTRSASHLGLAP
ncbi:hypothetical protein QBC38DRAFT_523321 [Podospora fimiseda]|uniref:Uncharacterized protein n=1 Tax=Podospora fimiseda TaxID=252190 RepID=A0AAN7BYV9_9PEZI|nr:hypothetical protein QBC38DRAFT_523321 [Podospora fimiseda]